MDNIKIPKSNILNKLNKNRIFETIGEFDEPFLEIKDVFGQLVSTQCDTSEFNISYLDLYLQGLTNMCTQLYFDIAIAMDIAGSRSPFIGGGGKEYEFLYEYIKFIVNQNLAEVDFGNCLIEWNERQLVPRFLAPLTHRGKSLLEFINCIEAGYPTIMPETRLVQERLIELAFNTYSYDRIEKSKKIQELYMRELE